MQTKKLEQWYLKNHTAFPFRLTKDPYHIWVSEIMLQQTQLETVIPYYERFIKLYPDVYQLANATDDALKKAVEGIGYYRRFALMKKAANMIVKTFDGVFPKTYEEVISLPGIGLYTAGAIMSIAYNKPYGAVDGNVIRILSRQLNIQADMRIEKNKDLIRNINQALIEHTHPKIYTQSLMDLGRMICTPKQPKCESCPIAETCQAYALSIQNELPFMSKKSAVKDIHYVVLVIHTKDGLILRKRTESLLEGMYEYPQFEGESIQFIIDMLDEKQIMIDVLSDEILKTHIFTHQKWFMHIYECRLIGNHMDDSWQVFDESIIQTLPMATAHKKVRGI